MLLLPHITYIKAVAPREGCVSRNAASQANQNNVLVAPREGCVSRNIIFFFRLPMVLVAPREGCVSRNVVIPTSIKSNIMLHPVRGV